MPYVLSSNFQVCDVRPYVLSNFLLLRPVRSGVLELSEAGGVHHGKLEP
jgi:hypothetical protein